MPVVYITGDVFASTSELPQVSVNHVGRLQLAAVTNTVM